MQIFQFSLFLDYMDFSEVTSSADSDEELEAQIERNGNHNVLVFVFIVYLH